MIVQSATHRFGDDILIVSAETGRNEHLIEAGDNYLRDPTWSADGQRVVYSVFRYEGLIGVSRFVVNRIESLDVRTRTRSVFLDLLPTGKSAVGLTFSPDGRTLLFVTGPGRRIHAYSGGAPTFVVEGASPAWHPDGRSILFARGYGCPPYPCEGNELLLLRLP